MGVMQGLRQLIVKLHQCAENMHTTLADLSSSIAEDEASGGTSSLIDPHKRFEQEQMLINIEVQRTVSLTDFREATELLGRLIDFTEPNEIHTATNTDQLGDQSLNVINEEENEQIMDMSPPRVVEARGAMRQIHNEMLTEVGQGGVFARDIEHFADLVEQGKTAAEAGASAIVPRHIDAEPSAKVTDDSSPTLVAISDFDPPPTHSTQMLKLLVGDAITVLGQDGRGWWYGRKQNGTEGWFPPSYVQVKQAHFSAKPQSTSK